MTEKHFIRIKKSLNMNRYTTDWNKIFAKPIS